MDFSKMEAQFVIFILFFYSSFSIPLNVTQEEKLGKIPSDPLIKNIVKYYDTIENVKEQIPADPDLLHEHWLGDISKLRGVEDSVCGDTDERERIEVSKSVTEHYQWTCWLKIYAKKNGMGYWTGTGFLLNVPGITGSIMLTSAHCIWLGGYYGGLAKKIVVQCPGYDPVVVLTDDLYADAGYIDGYAEDHDIGAIYLKEKFDQRDGWHLKVTGYPWTNALSTTELSRKTMATCGYPGDKDAGSMWSVDGAIKKVSDQRVFYMADTYGGQSGSPVYVDVGDGAKTVVAVHGYGGCPNSAVRLTRDHMTPILDHVQYKGLSVSLKSYFVPNAFLRANGPSAMINAQFGCYKHGAESFDVIPVQVSGAGDIKVILSPKAWPNMVVSVDKKRGCHIKLAKAICASTTFTIVQNGPNGSFSFYHEDHNNEKSRVFLRLSADDVTTWREGGGGKVSCGAERSNDDQFEIQAKETCNL